MSSHAGKRVTIKSDLGKKCVQFQIDQRHAASKKIKRQEKRRAAKLNAMEQVEAHLPNDLVTKMDGTNAYA